MEMDLLEIVRESVDYISQHKIDVALIGYGTNIMVEWMLGAIAGYRHNNLYYRLNPVREKFNQLESIDPSYLSPDGQAELSRIKAEYDALNAELKPKMDELERKRGVHLFRGIFTAIVWYMLKDSTKESILKRHGN